MLLRTIALVGGLGGAVGFSQFPEFSQQYVQRLGGAVDELQQFVAEFDADAAEAGMDRAGALADLAQGGTFGAARAETMTNTIARFDRLAESYRLIKDAGPFMRAYSVAHLNDGEIARATYDDFRPALPLTFEGLFFAIAGLLAGALSVGGLGALIRAPFRG